MGTTTNTLNESNESTRRARIQADQSLHRLEHSIDELADHLGHTRDRVERARHWLDTPQRWSGQIIKELKSNPEVYALIAATLGAIFWFSSRRLAKT